MSPAGRGVGRRVLGYLAKYGTLLFLLLLTLFFSVKFPRSFPTLRNLFLVMNSIALTAIVAGGHTLVLVVGEFDLSVGAMASLGGIISVWLISMIGIPVPLAILCGVVVGGVVGIFNGFLVTKARVNALISTLGTSSLLVGINYIITSGRPLGMKPGPFTSIALGNLIPGIPNNVLIMCVMLFILWITLNRTDLGISMQAVGGNIEAARMSGILSERVKTIAYIFSGAYAALAGILLASRLGSGQVTAGDGYLMDGLAAAFLGSAVLRDGKFHIVGTFVGALTVGVGFSGIILFGLPTYIQLLFRGSILILAVSLSSIARVYASR